MKKVDKLNRISKVDDGVFNFILICDVTRVNVSLAHVLKIDPPTALTTNNSRFTPTVLLQKGKYASTLRFLIYVYDM